MSLARRSITSITWVTAANLAKLPVNLALTIILARLLPVEYFGIFAAMMAVVALSGAFFEFGLSGAYFHRSPETQDEDLATAILFTLRFVFNALWASLLLAGAILFTRDLQRTVLTVLTVSVFFSNLTAAPRVLLMRRVQHQRLAALDLTSFLTAGILSVMVAYFTASIWALLVGPLVSLFWSVVLLYLWKPVWKPRFAWELPVVRYFLRFGAKTVFANLLGVALDRVDDLWVSLYLGNLSLGYYSKAYRLAVQPRALLAEPVNTVAAATYAELKFDRLRLSQAFFRINALLVRTGFLLAGWLALIAPHFIRIFLGERWMPMLQAFQLMLVFTLLDPIKLTVASVLVAVGKPESISLIRSLQLLVMVFGLFVIGSRYDIAGVALAVDIMLVVGMLFFFSSVRRYVDFSLASLFLAPLAALLIAGILALAGAAFLDPVAQDWLLLFVKSVVFIPAFVILLVAFEGRRLWKIMHSVYDLLIARRDSLRLSQLQEL
jgi:O-antigen/teichoic acid export membrane protein